jgi:glycosyltransferase involved in cell wall biosynthesis
MSIEVSVVIPAKDEEESIPELCQWIARVMQEHGISYEIIFVDDGSTDGTWGKIAGINEDNPRINSPVNTIPINISRTPKK